MVEAGGPSIPGPRLEAAILRPDLAGISSIIFSFPTQYTAVLMFLLLLDMRTAGIDQSEWSSFSDDSSLTFFLFRPPCRMIDLSK